MGTSIREQILARFATILSAVVGASSIYRARETAITRDATPSIAVLYGGSRGVRRAAVGVDQHEIEVTVAIFVRGDPWDQIVDPIDTQAHQLIMDDATLKAWGVEVFREADQPEAQEADRTAGTLSVTYRCVFLTRSNDITAAP